MLHYAKEASRLSYKIDIDSISIKYNESLSELYWDIKMYNEYRDINKKNLSVSLKLNDSSTIGKASINLGEYYRKKTPYSDSSYHHYHTSVKIYQILDNKYDLARALYGISAIQCGEKEYIMSEKTSIEALTLLKELEETNDVNRIKSFIYNNLGIVYNMLNMFSESIKYHKKGIDLKKKLKGNYKASIYNSLNNLATVYSRSGQYSLAISSFNKILKDESLLKEHPEIYAMALDNYAHTLYLSKNHKQLPDLYLKSLKIANSANAEYKSIIIYQHLAEYYYDNHRKDSARYYAYKAKNISQKYYNDDLLKSLLILSKIEDDSIAVKHYDAYIKLNDSIQKNERTIRNKFARIQYETDTYIDETKRLTSQNILITIIGLIIILVFALILIIRIQITKNRVLRFEGEQQKANEEIYTLMLRQQAKIEEGRLLERHHISEELHDGILNKLLGSRLGLEFLVIDEKNKEKNKEKFNIYIEEIRTIEKEIRDLSHELKNTKLDAEKDFITILKNYVDYQSNLHTFQYKFNHAANILWESINDHVKVNLYRIIQEAIQNIVKHAKATTITINFSLDRNEIQLDIIDDGTGFNSNKESKGIGLLNIKSRVSKLKGKLKISSETKKGTLLIIRLPVNQK
ncbi:hypothetical protein C1H87_03360 [Flavivirga eckloniae]|uniref:histidine kinase n=2 Tax=Flavivirga eckloniae TaxID=1803846 RepID=A0A2K9PL59_9FLAO|nr:hypothetical protein C1H87_03360 [Flavivirga eckloniae]